MSNPAEEDAEAAKQQTQESPTHSLDSPDDMFRCGNLPYREKEKDKYTNTLVAERLVYAMTKMGTSTKVVREFITYIVDVESLDAMYANHLYRYPDFTDAQNEASDHFSKEQQSYNPTQETGEIFDPPSTIKDEKN